MCVHTKRESLYFTFSAIDPVAGMVYLPSMFSRASILQIWQLESWGFSAIRKLSLDFCKTVKFKKGYKHDDRLSISWTIRFNDGFENNWLQFVLKWPLISLSLAFPAYVFRKKRKYSFYLLVLCCFWIIKLSLTKKNKIYI